MGDPDHAELPLRRVIDAAPGLLHGSHAEVPVRSPRAPPPGLVHAIEGGDEAVARIAATQHGLMTREQLVAAGLGRGAIAHRVARGRLHALHRGVYLVGHVASPPLAHRLAAVLACGEGTVLSHCSAAVVWALLAWVSGQHDEDVTVAGRDVRSRPGIRVHQACALDRRDVTRQMAIPITTPARTLVDLAGVVAPRELERALDEATTRRLIRPDALRRTLERTGSRPGVSTLRKLLARESGPALTRSEAEERLLHLVRAGGLRRPRVNARVGRYEVDLLWGAERLVVEIDGYRFHSSRAAFERDRLRDADLGAAGLRVMRITWRQLVDEPHAVLVRLAGALAVPWAGQSEDARPPSPGTAHR